MPEKSSEKGFRQDLTPLLHCLTAAMKAQGFTVKVHFELEGAYRPTHAHGKLNLPAINQQLKRLGIAGEIKPEYWQCQWEYVSLFNHQTPAEEATFLAKAFQYLPQIMCQNGAAEVFFVPVVWGGDKGRYMNGSSAIFSTDQRPVHIPNAVQINVSIEDKKKNNLIATTSLGEWLQWQMLTASYRCCLLFLPEEDAFKRLGLRENYNLDAELSSPYELSGGHQGSVALYREKGKHNQAMGLTPLIYSSENTILSYQHDWQKTARVEHRLGATSAAYDPYINMLFVLLCALESVEMWQQTDNLPEPCQPQALPTSLHDRNGQLGAISLFNQDAWFERTLYKYTSNLPEPIRSQAFSVKSQFLSQFHHTFSILDS